MQSPTLTKEMLLAEGLDKTPMLVQCRIINTFLTLVWKECLQCKVVWSLFMDSIHILQSSSKLSFGFDQYEAELCTPPHAVPPNLSRPIEPVLTQRLYRKLYWYSHITCTITGLNKSSLTHFNDSYDFYFKEYYHLYISFTLIHFKAHVT
jgi:hypothetical protein